MDRAARAKGALVVEGPTDQAVLSRAFSIDPRVIFPADGRPNVLRVTESLLADKLAGVVSIVDRDFDFVPEHWEGARLLVLYDDADLEAMIFNTFVFDRFANEWASNDKLAALGGPRELRRLVYLALTPIAALRSANAREGWGLVFDELDLSRVIDKRSLVLNVTKLAARLSSGARGPGMQVLQEEAQSEGPACPVTGRTLVCGHDALEVLGIALRNLAGSLSHQQTANAFVERVMRSMVGPGDLDGTEFANRLRVALQRAINSDQQ